jgi:hypothetical protein
VSPNKKQWYQMNFFASKEGGIVFKHVVTPEGAYAIRIVANCPHPKAVEAAMRLMNGQ